MIRLLFLTAIWILVLVSYLLEESTDIRATVLFSVIILSHLCLALLVRERRRYLERLYDWAQQNPNRIDRHSRIHIGSPIGYAVDEKTQCRRFVAVTSLALFTFQIQIFAMEKMVYPTAIIATLWTLIFGWWSLPLGPIQTVKRIYQNLKGGEVKYLGDISEWGENWVVQN